MGALRQRRRVVKAIPELEIEIIKVYVGLPWRTRFLILMGPSVTSAVGDHDLDALLAEAIAELHDPAHQLSSLQHNLCVCEGDQTAGGGIVSVTVEHESHWPEETFLRLMTERITAVISRLVNGESLRLHFQHYVTHLQVALQRYFKLRQIPAELQRRWCEEGPSRAHLVDLKGVPALA